MADNRILAAIQALGPSFEMTDRSDRFDRDDRPRPTPRPCVDDVDDDSGQIAQLSDIARMRAFITAGRAIFTLAGRTSRYTFKITRKDPEPGSTYTQPAYFVSMLTGPDNTADYTYLGILQATTGEVRITRKSTYRQDSKPIVALNWALGRIWRGQDLAPHGAFYHVGRCGRCGRALTVPSSIESGLGPECAGKLGGE